MIERSLYRHPVMMAGLIVLSAILLGALIFGLSKAENQPPANQSRQVSQVDQMDTMDRVLADLDQKNLELELHQGLQLRGNNSASNTIVPEFGEQLQNILQTLTQKPEQARAFLQELTDIQGRRESGSLAANELDAWTVFITTVVHSPAVQDRMLARMIFEELHQLGFEDLLLEIAAGPKVDSLGFRIELLQILPELQSPSARQVAQKWVSELADKASLSEVLAILPQAKTIFQQDMIGSLDWFRRLQHRVCHATSPASEQLRWQLLRHFPGHHCEAHL